MNKKQNLVLDKVKEAEFFLNQLRATLNTKDSFRYNLSAFVRVMPLGSGLYFPYNLGREEVQRAVAQPTPLEIDEAQSS
jgi:hypothetical protein